MNKHQQPVGHVNNANIPQGIAETIAATKPNVKDNQQRENPLKEMFKDITPLGTVVNIPQDKR